MSEETPQERQENELEVLNSVYGKDVEDLRKSIPWNVWRPMDILLTLHPLHNSSVKGVHCSVTLQFTCCAEYPNKPPTIRINKMHGLSNQNGEKLLDELNELAFRSCGEVMIFLLAQHVQQFLYEYNKPSLSFYEQMVKEKDEMEKQRIEEQKAKETEERQRLLDEINKIRLESGKRIRTMSELVADDYAAQGDARNLIYYADTPGMAVRSDSCNIECNCNIRSSQILRITQRNNKRFYIGNCIAHSANGSITFLAIDDDSGDRFIAKKWSLSPASDYQCRQKQLNLLQQDFKAMCKIKHENLLPYIVMELPKETSKKVSEPCAYIFREFVLGTSLKLLKDKFNTFSDRDEGLKMLRHVALGVFRALHELHSVYVLHMDVNAENVFLDDCGVVKLAGAALDVRLAEMSEGGSFCDKHTQPQDIYTTAQLLLSLVSEQGESSQEIPPDLPIPAKDFFSRCLTDNEVSPWSAEQLMNHGFLVDTPQKELSAKKLVNDEDTDSEGDEDAKKLNHSSFPINVQSRLHLEFEVLTFLGSGGFGEVLKVKNKLDGRFYAIKSVKLNPDNVQLNRKITREVTLLSRLSHENVVRYYNAWIESMTDMTCEEDGSEATTPCIQSEKDRHNSLERDIAKLGGHGVKLEWSMSGAPIQKTVSSDTDDEDDDEPDPLFARNVDEDSEGVIFENDSDNESKTLPSDMTRDSQGQSLSKILYIQMEFCDNNTLRQAIDNGLCQEHFRAWRLFREIVEGLAHVHQRGMIHRDLKPVNIFLDSKDHVKIGDFGLATKAYTVLAAEDKVKPTEEVGGSLTGQIGTALYVAPEILEAGTKVVYNKKVDIYSLGIILFEMFHRPFNTTMERTLTLHSLRAKEINMPEDFLTEERVKQRHCIRWLLNHNASLRPTCAELLASEHVPRSVPEKTVSELISHALSVRTSTRYEKVVTACLDQSFSPALDVMYHQEMKPKPSDLLAAIKDNVIKIFRSHGATEFLPPLLTPRSKCWDQYPNAVKLMTASGFVCHLPHDLRLPFARYIAYSGIKNMRRYVVDRIYREKQAKDFHPREVVECAFDIVCPKNDTLWSDAEVLVAASRAAIACSLKVTLQLNHTELLRVLLKSCEIAPDKQAELYPVLVDVSFGRITNQQLQTHLNSLCISNNSVDNLIRLMTADVGVYKLRELVIPLVKQAQLGKIAIQAVRELETVYTNATALGIDCNITVGPCMAYNATQHSGVFWQMCCERDDSRRDKRRARLQIAAGGRYDALVQEFWKVARTDSGKECTAVGFSMSLERMAAILNKMQTDVASTIDTSQSPLISVICLESAARTRSAAGAAALAGVASAAWREGLACCMSTSSDHVASPILLREDYAAVKVTYNHRVQVEKTVPYTEVLDFLKQILNQDALRNQDALVSRSTSWNDTDKSNSVTIAVTYITDSDKLNKNSKRQRENQIHAQITSTLTYLGMQSTLGRVRVNVVALSSPGACVSALVSALSAPLDRSQLTHTHLKHVYEIFGKCEKILDDAVEELTKYATSQNVQSRYNNNDEIQLYALYSIQDSFCRIIL